MDTRLDWHTGMELTPDTFIESDSIEYQYKVLLRKIVASKTYGLIPDIKKEMDWHVENDTIIVDSLKFNALARSGEIICVDFRQIEVTLPQIHTTEELYITVELTHETEKVIQNNVEKLRQKIVLAIKTLNELNERKSFNVIPFGKISSQFERYTKDEQYIPPIITIESSPDLRELIDIINKNISDIISHQNFSSEGNDLTIDILHDCIMHFNANNTPESYAELCRGFIMLISHYVLKEKVITPSFEANDIMIWFNWFKQLTDNSLNTLDSIVVEEPVVEEKEEPEIIDEFIPIL